MKNAHFKNLPKLVCDARMQKKISQAKLGKAIGLTKGQFISNCERGLCSIPVKYWKKLSRTLDIPIDDLTKAYLADEREKIKLIVR